MLLSKAQSPEITHSNIPQEGDQVIIAICSDSIDPGPDGTNQTWDMSGLTEVEEQYFTYIPPTEGILADSFPGANLCAVSWLDDYSYYHVSDDALTVKGYVVTQDPSDTSVVIYNNTEQFLSLPYSYTTSFTDVFDGDLYIPGFTGLTFEGTLDFEADGYGTLILPNATYYNVVRYHFFQEQTNYFNGIPAVTSTKEQWAWVSSDYRFWLLLMEEVFDGFSTSPLIWYDKNPYPVTTGYSTYKMKENIVYPNPLKIGQVVKINWDADEMAEVSLHRPDGSLLHLETLYLSPGPIYYNCPVLGAGLYILKIGTQHRYVTQKLIVMD